MEVQFVRICHVYLQNTHRRAPFFIDNQRFFGFSHKQNWAVFTDERFCALMNHHVLLAIQAKLKLALTRPKSLQKCGKSRETLEFWNAAISKYIQLTFYYFM